MSTKKNEKSFNDLLFDYQTRLQGVANDLGDKLARLISTTDADVLKLIVKELPRREKNVRAEIRRLERLIKKIEKTRAPGFELGRDLVFQTARDVAELSSDQTVSEAAAARNEADFAVEKPRAKTLSATAFANVVDFQPIEGASIATWYSALQRKDLERIANVVTRAAVEGLTVSKIAREIRGTKESGYGDGILQTTRNGAVALARTVINGVSNNARIETIRENADAIDGARFVGTLDGKTCPHCGALDGTVWGPDKLDKIRRPPLHVSCRCCVVPHVELRTPDGKIVEIGSRPAANADFDALAKEAYNEAARKKSSPRRWDDLSPSTRLKYYYKAQKDFEKRTGKPAYRQVSPSTTFAEYFERQDDAFKRSWLGAKRYEAYRNGAKFGDVAKPSATYRATLPELPQTPGNGPIPPSNASETPSTANDPTQAETSPQEPKIDRSTLPDFDGSPKQNAWAADLREKELDEWEAVALSERVKKAVEPAKSKRRFFYNAEVERQKDLVRAEIEKRGEAVVLAEMEAAAREIAAEIFANPSARDWIDGRDGPSVWARAINEARRRVATTGSAAKPKPAFDLPPLDLPPLSLPRLSGSPRQIEWAEDLRRRAVRDLTEERANETIAPRDHVQRWRQWSTRRDAKKIRDELPELEAAIAEVGGDDAAAQILGRETFLKAREFVEAWDDSRDWIDLKTEQKVDLNAYAAQKVAGTPKEAAAILRRYAANAKAQSDANTERAAPVVPERFQKLFAAFESDEYRKLLGDAPTLGLAPSSEFQKAFAPFDAVFRKIEKAINEERADNSPFGRFILEADQDDARAALLSRKNDVARRLLGFNVPESTANRQFLRNRAGGAFWDIGEKYGANFRDNASRGLDFTARVLDNIGVDAKELFSSSQKLRFSSTLDERGSYRGGLVILPKSPTSIGGAVAHEIGHALEEWLGREDGDKESKTRQAAQKLLKKYTTKNGRRTKVFPLCERYPGKGFQPNEMAWEPKRQGLVPDEYILKIYETGETEIVSKWFEYLYKAPYQLTCQYPEFYDDVKEFLK